MARIAICLGFRNWHREHLQRCLQSLRAGAPDWPILVADTGSPEPDMPEIRRLCAEVSARLVCEVQPEWSRSRALNLAARQAPDADTYIFTDADMIFPALWFVAARAVLAPQPRFCQCGRRLDQGRDGFVECSERPTHLGHDSVPNPNAWLWMTRARDLSEVDTDNLDGPIEDTWLAAHSQAHPAVGQGAAMVVPGPWFRRVGGFDEFYRIWGAEDNDLVQRAIWDGLAVDWLRRGGWNSGCGDESLAWVVHQWHRRDWPTPAQFEQVRRNRQYLAERLVQRGPIVRNQEATP